MRQFGAVIPMATKRWQWATHVLRISGSLPLGAAFPVSPCHRFSILFQKHSFPPLLLPDHSPLYLLPILIIITLPLYYLIP